MSKTRPSDESQLPVLVIVSGSPASGKSSLAEQIASELGIPLLSRDDIKEAIMDVIPVDNVELSHVIGAASFVSMYRVLDRLLDSGTGVVLESTFERGRSESDLRDRFEQCRAIQIHCRADSSELKERLAKRIQTGSRHPGHQDAAAYVEIEDAIASGDYDPLDLDIPLIPVESSDGFSPGVTDIVIRIGLLLE